MVLLRQVDGAMAVRIALELRLDLATATDRIEDAERGIRLARNDLLPDLSLRASAGYGSDDREDLQTSIDDARADYRVAVRLTLPLDQRQERFAYDESVVALAEAQRGYASTRDNVIEGVRRALRDLRRAEASLRIQERTREQAALRLRKSLADFEAGLISNRDLVEAQGELRDAETAVFQARIDYRDADLRLRRETGVLQVDENGQWVDAVLPYHRGEPTSSTDPMNDNPTRAEPSNDGSTNAIGSDEETAE